MRILPDLVHSHYYRHYEYLEENVTEEAAWSSHYEVFIIFLLLIVTF